MCAECRRKSLRPVGYSSITCGSSGFPLLLSLQCYKSSKDHTPQMELTLSGCSITHVPKDGKKKKHELKIVHQGADPLVLAVQSKEQAEEWLKVSDVKSKC